MIIRCWKCNTVIVVPNIEDRENTDVDRPRAGSGDCNRCGSTYNVQVERTTFSPNAKPTIAPPPAA